MKDRLQTVIEANVALQKRARELNTRAGEEVFRIMSQSEWKQWLAEELKGVRNVAEIQDFDALMLPPIKQDMVETILQENPDEVTVLDTLFSVSYRDGYNPQIQLEGDAVEQNRWVELPDAGIKLPGGRDIEVKVIIKPGYFGSSYTDTGISALKEKIKNHFNQKVWEKWEKPKIEIPDFTTENISIPEIEVREYGKCVVTKSSLKAYGTVIAYHYWPSDPITWKYEWYQDKRIAEENRKNTILMLKQYQSEERKKRS